jgi:phosphoribosylformimino-5-aminoimidazole carboxamide ribotide isomerase
MLLIPAIDLLAGRCVRLYQGNFDADIRYVRQALEQLRHFESLGVSWLHVVDLDGARDGLPGNGSLIASLAREGTVRLQVGGGVRSAEVIEALLAAGVARVVIGSAAVQKPVEVLGWLRRFGPEKICLAFDVRIGENGEPRVYAQGWRQNSALSLWDAISVFPGDMVRHVLCTDIGRDGALTGPNLALYRDAVSQFPDLAWQASGGVRDATDLAALARLGVAAAVSGRALREDRIALEELRPFLPDVLSPASTSVTAGS